MILALTLLGFSAAERIAHTAAAGSPVLPDPEGAGLQLLCYGVVGAVLVARRPDLPFGWLLAIGVGAWLIVLAVAVPSLAALEAGRGGQLAVWGACLGVLGFVPDTIPGLINVRFPSGRPASRAGRLLDGAMRLGIVIALVGTFLGDTIVRDLIRPPGHPVPARRHIDGTTLTTVGNASSLAIPIVILLGVLAGIGVIVRCWKASGIERRQLEWRAVGATLDLVVFPLAVTQGLPAFIARLGPLVFVATLLIPVLRYQLWAGDPTATPRRGSVLVSRRRLIEAREDERRRLRRDLHDGLGPLLTGLRLNLDAVEAHLTSDPGKAHQHLSNARQASAEVITDLRNLVSDLRPPAIDELGLVGALRVRLCPLADEAHLILTLAAPQEVVVPAAVEVAIYRTAIESVSNVIQHSTATSCRVSIQGSSTATTVTVDDNGHVAHTWHPGVGLASMRERATELGGTFVASSGPDGFHIHATYPCRGF